MRVLHEDRAHREQSVREFIQQRLDHGQLHALVVLVCELEGRQDVLLLEVEHVVVEQVEVDVYLVETEDARSQALVLNQLLHQLFGQVRRKAQMDIPVLRHFLLVCHFFFFFVLKIFK